MEDHRKRPRIYNRQDKIGRPPNKAGASLILTLQNLTAVLTATSLA